MNPPIDGSTGELFCNCSPALQLPAAFFQSLDQVLFLR
jgi:hypothetical protein